MGHFVWDVLHCLLTKKISFGEIPKDGGSMFLPSFGIYPHGVTTQKTDVNVEFTTFINHAACRLLKHPFIYLLNYS
jgi:hypothetical protein